MKKNKLFSILSLTLLFAMMVNLCFTGIVFAASGENTVKQNGLQNSMYQLKNGEKFTVGYFGGSITVGFGAKNSGGYAGLTYDWLTKTYQKNTAGNDIAFTKINAGIGGTGTSHGAYRADSALKLGTDKQPDLTFVEFAINDKYDGVSYEKAAKNMETIVRKLYKANPKMDIVILFTTDIYSFDYENDGNGVWKDWEALKAHQEIADRYGIPTIYIGKTLNQKIYEENGNQIPRPSNYTTNEVWKKYIADTVHPTDAGYAVYAEEIENYIETEYAKTVSSQTDMVLDAAKYDVQEDAYYASIDAHNPAGNQWKKNSDGIYTDGANQVLHFKFTGTGVDIHTKDSVKNDFGTLTVYIDGVKETVNINSGDRMINIAQNLTNAKHDVVIITNEDTVPSGKSIVATEIGITGDASKSGIEFNLDSEREYLTPSEVVKDIDFMVEIEGYKKAPYADNPWYNNVIASFQGEAEDGTKVSATPEKYRTPMFFKYDLSSYKNRAISGARLFAKLNQTSYCIKSYDVPGDDLTYLDSEGKYFRIPVNTTNISETWSGSTKPVSYYLDANDSRINVSDYNMNIDMTASYINGEANSTNSVATFALMDAWSGFYQVNKDVTPILMIDMPYEANAGVTLTAVNSGNDVIITATPADSSSMADIADVEFYVNGIKHTGTVTKSNGVFTATLEGLADSSYSVTAKAVDMYGNATEKTINKGTAQTQLIAMQGYGYKYITDYYQWDTKNRVWGFEKANSYPVATAEVTVDDVKTTHKATYAYMQYDLSDVNFEDVDKAYLIYSARKAKGDYEGDERSWCNVDFDRCSSYTAESIKNSDNTPKTLPTQYEAIATRVPLNKNQLTESDKDYNVLKNIATAADSNFEVGLYKLDISDYFKTSAKDAVKNGDNFGIQVSRSDKDGGGDISFRSAVYIYVTYKTKIAEDNGTSVTVTFNPSEYAESGSVTVIVADYDSTGSLINAVRKEVAVTDAITSFDVNKAANSALTKVLMWNDIDSTLMPLTEAVAFTN